MKRETLYMVLLRRSGFFHKGVVGFLLLAAFVGCSTVNSDDVRVRSGTPDFAKVDPPPVIPFDSQKPIYLVAIEPVEFSPIALLSPTVGRQGMEQNVLASKLTTALVNDGNIALLDSKALRRNDDGSYQARLDRREIGPFVVRCVITEFTENIRHSDRNNRADLAWPGTVAGIAGGLAKNFKRLQKKDPAVTLEDVKARGKYLHDLFYPEVLAVLQLAEERGIDPFSLKGSRAGAFGIPQFLPTTYLKFGVDFDGDGVTSLFDIEDAVASVANFLASFGWQNGGTIEDKKKVIWRYNRSDAYVDTVLAVAELLENAV